MATHIATPSPAGSNAGAPAAPPTGGVIANPVAIPFNVDSLAVANALTAGSVASTGAVSGTTGTFSGAVAGTTGTFSGAVTASGGFSPAAAVLTTANGASRTLASISELITLSTIGATTDSTANLLPANSVIESVVARVTTTITTATAWKLGDATVSGRFAADNATMTAGATSIGLVHIDQSSTSGPRQTAAAKLRITTTGTPGAGVVRVTVFYRQYVAPTS